MCRKIALFCLVMLLAVLTQAQNPTQSASDTSDVKGRLIQIDWAEEFTFSKLDGDTLQRLRDDVQLRQDSVYMYCDSATIINDVYLVAQGNVVLQQGDSLNIFADSLNYDGKQKLAYLFGNVVLENNEQQLFTDRLDYDLTSKIATYNAGALLTDGATQLTSKRGYYFTEADEVFFKDSVVVIDPAFDLRADTLKLNTNTQVVTFLSPTLIRSDSVNIYCEEGFYNIADSLAEFRVNAQLQKGAQQATADTIRYEGETAIYTLAGNAFFQENERQATADQIQYDQKIDKTLLIGNARYEDAEQLIVADEIYYDARNETYRTVGRAYIEEESQILQADSVDFDQITGLGLAKGDVIWQDIEADVRIQSDYAIYNQATDFFKASGGRPLLMTVLDGDTLYMASDTLTALRKVDTIQQDTSRVLVANKHVKIYKSDLQAVCDSLTYNTKDSLFRFFKEPIIWSDTSQFVADTIRLLLRANKIDRIGLYQKALILNSPDERYFNQIKGKTIDAYFSDSNLRRMEVTGNAESVYYAPM
ncbi:MAG: OstA-like protein [Bacteroidota bacterium]